jgi:hypothetical protein
MIIICSVQHIVVYPEPVYNGVEISNSLPFCIITVYSFLVRGSFVNGCKEKEGITIISYFPLQTLLTT